MALKPIPKALLIVVVVAAAGYGLTKVNFKQEQAAAAPQAEAPTVVTPPTQAQVEAAQAEVPRTIPEQERPPLAAAPAENAPTPQQDHDDAGLKAVLGIGK